MDKSMKKIEKSWKYVTLIGTIIITVFSILVGAFSFGYRVLDEFDKQNTLLEDTAKLAEKSFIWNKEIPRVERAEVCDLYLAKGYDSYTKKLCENVILQDETLTLNNESEEE